MEFCTFWPGFCINEGFFIYGSFLIIGALYCCCGIFFCWLETGETDYYAYSYWYVVFCFLYKSTGFTEVLADVLGPKLF